MEIWVLRLDHRLVRDTRTTTHVMLVARAFGARGVIYTGRRDDTLENKVVEIVEEWGGPFDVVYREDWKKAVRDWRSAGGGIVHLTMYGEPISAMIGEIRKRSADLLVVVGGAKVPGEVYGCTDWNIAVTSQPHSEVGALSIFLHEFFEGDELGRQFENFRSRVIPQKRGKKVVRSGNVVH